MTAPVVQTRKTGPPKCCPECGCSKLWRDGLRYLADDSTVQRWFCRNCGYRFSEEQLNKTFSINVKRRVCVSMARNTKNLAEKPLETRLAGATDAKTIKGLIVQYAYFLETNGYYKNSAYLQRIKHLTKLGANLLDPEDVKKVIALETCNDSTKLIDVCAYDLMVKHVLKTTWTRPRYRQVEHLPFIPKETELDQLISATKSKRMATFLQTLKETFADPGEALRIEWKDLTGNVLTINHPVKGHRPGKYKISNKLVSMLNNLPQKANRIFPTTYQSMVHSYNRMRKRLAQKIQNPRIRSISLTTFRHWGGTMIAHRTNGNVLKVQKALRHKCIKNTMKYINLVGFKDSDYDVEFAETLEEAKKLLKLGYDYVTDMNGAKIFRKPKMYGVGG